ncbi:hypothetical protein [Pseudonocardia sp. GCM10023141]|uniref:hypothetical protein n=1 Tax=Pseudonocardia sp. GCM10023141 TaxID=3252653 RepID=UPI003612CC50
MRATWARSEVLPGPRARAPVGPYQVQAAIAAVHAEAQQAVDTDWPQVLALYDLLLRLAPGPAVALNRVVAVGRCTARARAAARRATSLPEQRYLREQVDRLS